jgi:hypothetical protein
MTLMRPKFLISSTNLNPTHLNLHSHPSITVMMMLLPRFPHTFHLPNLEPPNEPFSSAAIGQ